MPAFLAAEIPLCRKQAYAPAGNISGEKATVAWLPMFSKAPSFTIHALQYAINGGIKKCCYIPVESIVFWYPFLGSVTLGFILFYLPRSSRGYLGENPYPSLSSYEGLHLRQIHLKSSAYVGLRASDTHNTVSQCLSSRVWRFDPPFGGQNWPRLTEPMVRYPAYWQAPLVRWFPAAWGRRFEGRKDSWPNS